MLLNLKLGTRFTLILAAVLLTGSLVNGFFVWQTVVIRAQNEVSSKAMALMEMIISVRTYTTDHIEPLLKDHEEEFIEEVVPAFSARRIFTIFRQQEEFADLTYKEATLNPTTLLDKADEFEVNLIEEMRRQPERLEFSGYRKLSEADVFYNARPIVVESASCLECHGDPQAAPASLIATYGSENGFGWQLNQVVGAQVLYLPTKDIIEPARSAFFLLMAIFIGVTVCALFFINLALKGYVLRPIQAMAGLAGRISNDQMVSEDLEGEGFTSLTRRSDELGQWAQVFGQMAAEVYARTKVLKRQVQELLIEIDQAKYAKQVEEVVETDFFRDLQAKSHRLRAQTNLTVTDPTMTGESLPEKS